MNNKTWQKYLAKVLDADDLHIHEANYDILGIFKLHIPPQIYSKVLDIASGIGVDVYELQKMGYDAYGLELNSDAIGYAKEHFGIKSYYGDMHHIPLRSGTFNAILSIQAFEHALSPYIALSEMNRIMRMGGRIFIDTCDPDDDDMWTPQHPSLLYPRQIHKLAKHLGFELIKDLSRKHRTQIVLEKCNEVKKS